MRNAILNTETSGPNNSRRIATGIPLKLKQTSDYGSPLKQKYLREKYLSPEKLLILCNVIRLCQALLKKSVVHSVIAMGSAGLHYVDDKDTVRCYECGLNVSGWTLDMNPFTVHAQRSPDCPFVRSTLPDHATTLPSAKTISLPISAVSDVENPLKRQKTDEIRNVFQQAGLVEVNLLKEIRKQSFSHWPHRTSPSKAQVIEAGFFNCNVGDRTICLYCNLICQQWIPHADDPWEMHKILSPKCPYVLTMLRHRQTASIQIINERPINNNSLASNTTDVFRSQEIVYAAACNPHYMEIPKRHASFSTWPNENLPSVENLVKAGFFFTGTKTIVTCFYCNGSLQNWGSNDNPIVEHARWFPQCAYAKQLCGEEMHRKIQESKRLQQERANLKESNKAASEATTSNTGTGKLDIRDETTLSRYVAARLDWPISQMLLVRNFKLSIIKRCYEDQLRLKQDDFIGDCYLFVACKILQKQIDHIGGKKDNIIVPSIAMKKIREAEQPGISEITSKYESIHFENVVALQAHEQATTTSAQTNSSSDTDVQLTTSSESTNNENNAAASTAVDEQTKQIESSATNAAPTPSGKTDDSFAENRCVLCLTEERRIACIPCGHLCACVPCGHSLRLCPICRREIEAFIRVYI
ncbi:unnamed protein product [Rotaria magnacalcarata]